MKGKGRSRKNNIYPKRRSLALTLAFCLALGMPFYAAATGSGELVIVDGPGASGGGSNGGSTGSEGASSGSGKGSSAADSLQDAKDKQEIADSKQKIEENRERLNALQSERGSIEDTLSALNELKTDAVAYIEELDAKVADINAQIEEIGAMMEDTEAEIENTKAELSRAEASRDDQYASMKLRIKYMYENGSSGSLDMLLDSGSFSELLNRAEYIRKVSEYDRDKLEEYKLTVREVSDKETQLNEEYQSLEEIAAENEQARSDMEKLQADKAAELSAYNARISEAGAELDSMEEDIASIQAAMVAEENNIAAIEAEMRRREEAKKAEAQASGESYETVSIGDISFIWPIASSRITSEFGSREAPLEGASTSHKGVDIGAATGTPIKAAASGSVVISTYSASAGNYIMINHGGGVYTVYMHMNSLSVSVGDEVSQGETIGTCGSTGNSTGPHLHFGIRVNGSYVNPMNYVSP